MDYLHSLRVNVRPSQMVQRSLLSDVTDTTSSVRRAATKTIIATATIAMTQSIISRMHLLIVTCKPPLFTGFAGEKWRLLVERRYLSSASRNSRVLLPLLAAILVLVTSPIVSLCLFTAFWQFTNYSKQLDYFTYLFA